MLKSRLRSSRPTSQGIPSGPLTYLPRPVLRLRLGSDGAEDGAEGAVAREARGIDDGADGGLAVCGPHGAVARGDPPLHDGGSQPPLAPVVGRRDGAGMIEEDQDLRSGSADRGLQ